MRQLEVSTHMSCRMGVLERQIAYGGGIVLEGIHRLMDYFCLHFLYNSVRVDNEIWWGLASDGRT